MALRVGPVINPLIKKEVNMKELYKTVCDKCRRKTWYENEQQCHCTYPKTKTCKLCGHTKEVYPPKMVRCTGTLRKIDYSSLDKRFDYAYNNNYRVEVTWKPGFEDYTGYGCRTNGQKARFNIGMSTGWKPVYLAILTKRSIGGSAICSDCVESIRIL